jgi:hypothetical protein
VARTVVGELAEATGTDKGKAFSLFGFCLAAGWIGEYVPCCILLCCIPAV